MHFMRRDASAFILLGAPIPFDGGLHPLLPPVRLNLGLSAAGGGTLQAELAVVCHVGGRSPGELSHSLT
jgi:hypothetical protein